MRLWFHSCS